MFSGTTTRELEELRGEMVQEQIHDRGVQNRRVLVWDCSLVMNLPGQYSFLKQDENAAQ